MVSSRFCWSTSVRETVTIRRGDRIAQLVVARAPQVGFVEAEDLDATERGVGGFGSTGR